MIFARIFTTLCISLTVCVSFAASELPAPLVETDWLAKNLDNVIVLDVRTNKKSFVSDPVFKKDKKTGKQSLVRVGGHIPGANLVLYKNVRGEQQIDGRKIKHMILSANKFEKLMQNAGVNQDSSIIVATNAESGFDLTMASRMYWQIKYFGHDQVSILNGGTAQWLLDEYKHEKTLSKSNKGNWVAKEQRQQLLATSEQVQTAIEKDTTQIVDVRQIGQYLGTYKSSKAKVKGHIPTAKLFPVDLLSNRSTPVKFSSQSELKELSYALGVDPQQELIAYCNSGHMASGGWFVFHELLNNKNTKLYDGSMHQWTLERRPIVKMKME